MGGQWLPDTFRIKIWWKGAGVENVIYVDGFKQAIGGLSIIVHKSKQDAKTR